MPNNIVVCIVAYVIGRIIIGFFPGAGLGELVATVIIGARIMWLIEKKFPENKDVEK